MLSKISSIALVALSIILILGSISGCSSIGKLSRSKNIEDREKAARILFNKKDYEKAGFLFEELLSIYKGTGKAEEILYLYASCKYNLKDYLTAAYYFNEYASQYPGSSKTEQAQYLYAYCFYQDSDPWYLDQTSTRKSLEFFQFYLKANPGSNRVDSCNELMSGMREKLAKKSFEQAYLYLKIGHYKAAIEAFKQTMDEFPDSKFREEAQFRQIIAAFRYADISVSDKQKKRYLDAMAYYRKFADKYPSSAFLRDAEPYYAKAQKALDKIQASGKSEVKNL